MFILIDLLF